MSSDYLSRRADIGRRAEKAPNEARTTASDWPRKPRLHYPHYATIFRHDSTDPDAERHETLRNIYLWNHSPDTRMNKPKQSQERQTHFESKYRSMIKDRKDHEWSRQYYYPGEERSKPAAAERKSRWEEDSDEEERRQRERSAGSRRSTTREPESDTYKSRHTSSYSRRRKEEYGSDDEKSGSDDDSSSVSSRHSHSRAQHDRTRATSSRSKNKHAEHPVIQASRSTRRMEAYLSQPDSVTSVSSSTRRSSTRAEPSASSSRLGSDHSRHSLADSHSRDTNISASSSSSKLKSDRHSQHSVHYEAPVEHEARHKRHASNSDDGHDQNQENGDSHVHSSDLPRSASHRSEHSHTSEHSKGSRSHGVEAVKDAPRRSSSADLTPHEHPVVHAIDAPIDPLDEAALSAAIDGTVIGLDAQDAFRSPVEADSALESTDTGHVEPSDIEQLAKEIEDEVAQELVQELADIAADTVLEVSAAESS